LNIFWSSHPTHIDGCYPMGARHDGRQREETVVRSDIQERLIAQ